MDEEERKERQLYAALDAGLASSRAKPDVWERVNAKVRRAQAMQTSPNVPSKHR